MLAIECVQPGTKEPNAAVAKAFIAECQKHKADPHGRLLPRQRRALPAALNISDDDMDPAMAIFEEARQGRLRLTPTHVPRPSARAGRSGAPPSLLSDLPVARAGARVAPAAASGAAPAVRAASGAVLDSGP